MQTSPHESDSTAPNAQARDAHAVGRHGDDQVLHVEDDNINAGLLSVIFTLVGVSVLLVVVLLQAWFYNLTNDMTQNREALVDDPQSLLGRALMEQRAKIKDYQWVNKEANVRAIPIDRAMELVTKEMHAAQATAAPPFTPSQPDKPTPVGKAEVKS